ncbi:HpcH/HpaI aldolase family protein [Pseudomonas cremoricolorata]|uniref:HpcH/HpaI aldolase family protein n=1 Tax=Pseudomonas cremoricolorata TaxID=157783 RepID=UPI000406BB63|nr:aldolase/citrate lyase family protein [Pseudomonas cremoricolorata]
MNPAPHLPAALADGARLIGPWVGIPDPTVVELMAALDNDFLLLDGEHTPIPPTALRGLLPCAERYHKPVLYRVPSHAPEHIKQALDAGVAGLMLPMVETAAQAAAIVDASRYAPLGTRGIGPWRASGYYQHFTDYLQQANARTLLIVQIESRLGLDNLEAIAAVPSIDVLYVGPSDLAQSLGLAPGPFRPALLAALQRVCAVGRAAGKTLGIDVPSAAELPALQAMGFSLFTLGSDIGFITQAGQAQARQLAELPSGAPCP